MTSMESKQFNYTNDDLIFTRKKNDESSQFDKKLCEDWDNLMDVGDVFRYNLSDVTRRIVDGKYKIVAQLNKKRFSDRRTPQAATSVVMPFDPTKFNFTKIKSQEILMDVKKHSSSEDGIIDRLVVNISPIEYGHTLLVPDCLHQHPQVMTIHGMQVATEIMLLSTKRGFCMGFNSLCALASVNHLHLHAFYIDEQLPIHCAHVEALNGWLFKTSGYLVNCLSVQLRANNIEEFSSHVLTVTNHFAEHEISHNLFICRNQIFGEMRANNEETVTCFIFPKKKCPGVKETRYLNSCCFDLAGYLLFKEITDNPFNAAFLECSGFLPIRDKVEYENMSENEAMGILRKYTLNDEDFTELCKSLILL